MAVLLESTYIILKALLNNIPYPNMPYVVDRMATRFANCAHSISFRSNVRIQGQQESSTNILYKIA